MRDRASVPSALAPIKQTMVRLRNAIRPLEVKERAARPSTARPPQMDDIPDLLATLERFTGERAAAAVKRLYELCDVCHKQNRVPMVHAGGYDVLRPLARCLTQSGDGRHLACLTLNNLSIPNENKRVMALGPSADAVIGGLCRVIAEDKRESYLCCICLMNLSFLEASIVPMLRHSPVAEGAAPLEPLDNPDSLLRILERRLKNASGVFHKSGSGKFECVRWACGLIKNLAKAEENSALFGKTDIAKCVVGNLRVATAPPGRWTSSSLEDSSLFVVLNLAQWPVSRQALVDAGALSVVPRVAADEGLQGLKATLACALLGARWSDYPRGGRTALHSISVLIANIREGKGEDGQYAPGAFKMETAAMAYDSLLDRATSAGEVIPTGVPIVSHGPSGALMDYLSS